MVEEEDFEYEAALSFAGEHRSVAEELAGILESFDVSVFYDLDAEIPGLNHTVGYLDLRKHSVEGVADLLMQKLRGSDYEGFYSDPPLNRKGIWSSLMG